MPNPKPAIIYDHPADEALDWLIEGNTQYVNRRQSTIISDRRVLLKAIKDGQKPYAIVVCCSDSRIIPEAIFDANIGDLFVIRVAGNVIDNHQLGSIEYAAEHLGTGLVVVLGHNHCGAVDAALYHKTDGYIQYLIKDIELAIGDEKDEFKACCLNVQHSCRKIEESLQIQKDEKEYGLKVVGAIYHMETGEVEFLD
ncbi:MAG: carbonic anhydrase [Clostridiales bacterium]|nr:carbonic anhydrase [Candidatus Crickella merdequi]